MMNPHALSKALSRGLDPAELDTIYVSPEDRLIVSLIVGYTEEDLAGEPPAEPQEGDVTPKAAALWALELTRDEGARGTHWFVFDRKDQQMYMFEQSDFDPEMEGL